MDPGQSDLRVSKYPYGQENRYLIYQREGIGTLLHSALYRGQLLTGFDRPMKKRGSIALRLLKHAGRR
jgi:hypothetical protein